VVLGLLAASPRETVSRARLTEALWGDDPPAHSATSQQTKLGLTPNQHVALCRDD
jgi:hypothetical protein